MKNGYVLEIEGFVLFNFLGEMIVWVQFVEEIEVGMKLTAIAS